MATRATLLQRLRLVVAALAFVLLAATSALGAGAHLTAAACGRPSGPNAVRCTAVLYTGQAADKIAVATSGPIGYGPAQLRAAYGLTGLSTVLPQSVQTVAIVDAYSDPRLASDLAYYRRYYHLPACTTASRCLRIVSQTGSARLPAPSAGWAMEMSLDAEVVSAVCPRCHILIVEATSPSYANLGAAENEAVHLGARVVSNSWGGADSPQDAIYDRRYFTHPGVAIVAAAGDFGYGGGAIYPSTSPDVTAVGGTALSVAPGGARGYVESAWSDGGSGCSLYEPMPAWQRDVPNAVAACGDKRAVTDVSADASPQTGVALYDTDGFHGWFPGMIGGTSLATPIVAAVYALAGNAAHLSGPAVRYTYLHTSYLHQNVFDTQGGSNGTCAIALQCTAGIGWDGPTGLGSPDGVGGF